MVSENWSKDELRTLKHEYRNTKNTVLARMLKRSPEAIRKRASRLKLRKSKQYLRKYKLAGGK
jgi:hypothetical protein